MELLKDNRKLFGYLITAVLMAIGIFKCATPEAWGAITVISLGFFGANSFEHKVKNGKING